MCLIAVIAGFNASLGMTVAAGRCAAVVETGIGIDFVAIVAGFNTAM